MIEKLTKTFIPSSKSVDNQLKQDRFLWLPDQLSGIILDLQFQCQTQNLNRKLVDLLVQCYSNAVEFYNQRGNYKYKIYQKRMQLFLSKPRIQEILKGRSVKMIIAQEKTKDQINKAEICNKKKAQQLIQQHERLSNSIYKKMRQNIKKQQQNLQQRIRKKRTMSNRSTKTNDHDNQIDDQFGRDQIGQKMNIKLLLEGINQRNKKVFF